MNPEFKKAIIDLWVNEFGAEECILSSYVECMHNIKCYKIGNTFIRLDCFKAIDGDGLLYCIEAADEEMAHYNAFEDAWLYWDGDGITKILEEMRKDLQTY